MQIEATVKPISPIFLRGDPTQFSQTKESFEKILQRSLNHKSSSRPPKIELIGILKPLQIEQRGCLFKIETDQSEYMLRMNKNLIPIAKELEWEDVVVKGYIDYEEEIFEVEKICISNRNQPLRLTLDPTTLSYDLEQYRKRIVRDGIVDISADYLAS